MAFEEDSAPTELGRELGLTNKEALDLCLSPGHRRQERLVVDRGRPGRPGPAQGSTPPRLRRPVQPEEAAPAAARAATSTGPGGQEGGSEEARADPAGRIRRAPAPGEASTRPRLVSSRGTTPARPAPARPAAAAPAPAPAAPARPPAAAPAAASAPATAARPPAAPMASAPPRRFTQVIHMVVHSKPARSSPAGLAGSSGCGAGHPPPALPRPGAEAGEAGRHRRPGPAADHRPATADAGALAPAASRCFPRTLTNAGRWQAGQQHLPGRAQEAGR